MYLNDFMPLDAGLRVWAVGHSEDVKKADCFVLTYGNEVYLIDGGIHGSYHAIKFLLDFRRRLTNKDLAMAIDSNWKLKLNLVVSHFHNDHVEALIESILPSPYLEFDNVYLPEVCGVPEHFNEIAKNGDRYYRNKLYELLDKYHPTHKIHIVPFGKESVLRFKSQTGLAKEVDFTVYPLPCDPGEADYLEYMIESYKKDGVRMEFHAYTYALNAASIWLKAEFAGRSFLFTGDTMKRRTDLPDEALDLMLDAYRDDVYGVDVLKYIHHGFARDAAAEAMLSLDPKYVILSTQLATAREAMLAIDPDTKAEIINCGLETYKFVVSDDGDLNVKLMTKAIATI